MIRRADRHRVDGLVGEQFPKVGDLLEAGGGALALAVEVRDPLGTIF